MKSQVKLLQAVLLDVGQQCGTSTSKDYAYILGRVEKEGRSFLTITLPTFGKGLEQALERGYLGSDLFPGFHRGKGGLPRLLSGFLSQIFLDNCCVAPTTSRVIDCVQAVRQITGLYSKLEDQCTRERESRALLSYVEVDASLISISPDILEEYYESTRPLARYLYEVENRLFRGEDFNPHHGPGAVAERLSSNGKYNSNVWTDRLEEVFPAFSTLCVNARDFLNTDVQFLALEQEPPVRVVTVPKTMKAPRIIAVEPTWMQYVQQGILGVMTDTLLTRNSNKEKDFSHYERCFGWTDQEPNRLLARSGCDGSFATIDLSEASDRVSLQIVETILRDHPFLLECVKSCRSTSALLPSGDVIALRKFASMGSAMCFPWESLVFAGCILMAKRICGLMRNNRNSSNLDGFRVFGDDMVVPTNIVPALLQVLEDMHLKVNINKSFWTGMFRESCGSDWYDGFDVKYVKVRHPFPKSRQDGLQILQVIDLHNRLFVRGLYGACKVLELQICNLGYPYYAPVGSTICAMYTWDESRFTTRWNNNLQRIEYKGVKTRVTLRDDPLHSYGALRKCLRYNGDEPLDLKHLERAGRSLHVAINVGWQFPWFKPRASTSDRWNTAA